MRGRGRRPARVSWWAVLILALTVAAQLPAARAAPAPPVMTLYTDELAGPRLMGLGVQWDPYDYFRPTQADWDRTFQRLDLMHPGFIRVVEPAFDYFGGYDAAHNPLYRWNARHLVQLREILDYAKSRGITVVLGDWSNPLIDNDPRIPAGFLARLHDVYGYTNIKYYNLINEPNYLTGCDFSCWTDVVRTLSCEFAAAGLSKWLELVGPDNANSWDDTPRAQALDKSSGLDSDNPIGGDSWVTGTLQVLPGLIGAYDSHRYSTVWGLEHGLYADQMRARREEIDNLDSPNKQYFAGEVGLTARQVDPFSMLARASAGTARLLAPLLDPSAMLSASAFVDSQPHIREFGYGVWMADMAIQAIDAGMAGASAWDLDDAMHVGGQYGSQNLKQWGFWNSLGGQDGYPATDLNVRPWYYPWSVLSRSFPAGSQAFVTPGSAGPGLRIAAAKIPNAGRYDLSFAVVNDSDIPRSVTLSVPSATAPLTLTRYDYFAGDRPADGAGLPIPAAVLADVTPSAGITLQLPSRGLIVLSSLGSHTATLLNDSAGLLLDNLNDWHQAYFHSNGLTLDHRTPAHFNDDRSRATPKRSRAQYLVYHASQTTSFELKAYYRRRLGLTAYGSEDGRTWTPITLESTHPAPALGGGGWYLAELLPGRPLPPGTNWLKVRLASNNTELSQVAIRHRSARFRPGAQRPETIPHVRLGGVESGSTQRSNAPAARKGPRIGLWHLPFTS